MPLSLTNQQREKLVTALLGAFTDTDSLVGEVWVRTGTRLDHRVDVTGARWPAVVRIVQYAEDAEWLETLIRAALPGAPLSMPLKRIAAELGLVELPPAPTTPPPPPVSLTDASLQEVIVRRRPPMLTSVFFDRLREVSRAVCWIGLRDATRENPQLGSGFLVGPDLLLTNWHVIRALAKNEVERAAVVCRFDYLSTGSGMAGVEAGLPEGWCLHHSPPAPSDEAVGGAAPTADQLDYALVRLDRTLDREWLQLREEPPPLLANDILFVVQHPADLPVPDEGAQRIAQGVVLGFEADGRRVRYDVGTTGGSSGSPVLTYDLQPAALHHGTEPIVDTTGGFVARARTFNRGIPLRPILKRMKDAGVPPFWP